MTARMMGATNCRMNASNANSHDSGCSRRCGCTCASDATTVTREELIAQRQRVGMRETRQLDLRVTAPGGVQLQRSDAITSFERALRDIGVLNTRSRQGSLRAPHQAALYHEPGFIHAVPQPAVVRRGVEPGDE